MQETITIKLPKSRFINLDPFDGQMVDIETIAGWSIYLNEYEDCKKKYGRDPSKLNTEKINECFKHYISHRIDYEDCSSYWFVDKLYRYNDIKHLTGNQSYVFYCLINSQMFEMRVPSTNKEVAQIGKQYVDELYKYILDHPEALIA
jgi:hypothetical protein